MKKILSVFIVAACALPFGAVQAASAAQQAQQDKMKTCNKQAGDKALKGDERKKFMSECLKANSTMAAAPAASSTPAATASKNASQQDKMKSCNKDAGTKQLKGDERKKFMSDCLKG